jgi:hypothetical protein
MKNCLFVCLIGIGLLCPAPAAGWNETGHQIVARIAWERMTPIAREATVRLLQDAPQDACLRELFPDDARPLAERQREFFLRASTWADLVRPRARDDSRPCVRYHRAGWHFINYFWEGRSDPDNPPDEHPTMRPPEDNAVTQLIGLTSSVVQATKPRGERALDLAWILHVAGDIHQPLHTSARVTSRPDEREGDRGGNDFKLGPADDALSLHAYWDTIVSLVVAPKPGERTGAYVERLAARIMERHPQAALSRCLRPGEYEAWAREGFRITRMAVYPASLSRGRMPDAGYRRTAYAIAESAIALAGYRLAEMMNRLF